eukprot:4167993-Pyramimonas_sp.AAC.1
MGPYDNRAIGLWSYGAIECAFSLVDDEDGHCDAGDQCNGGDDGDEGAKPAMMMMMRGEVSRE